MIGPKIVRLLVCVLVTFFSLARCIQASPYTPLEWQQPVGKHAMRALSGQLKHTSWVRDKNRNFIDDQIERRHRSDQLVDVIVDLNTSLAHESIKELLDRFGRLTYVGKLVTFVFLDDVRYDDLKRIAALPEVAMVELQEMGQVMLDVSARAVQSKPSVTYSPNTAGDTNSNGDGVVVAVLDTGVDDTHDQLAGKYVAGFNALNFTDANSNGTDDSCEPAPIGNGLCTDADDEPADGTYNPDDDNGHGTHVAGIALGQGDIGAQCRVSDDGSTPDDCAGVARDARLVDIKICSYWGWCAAEDVAEGLDWLGLNAGVFEVRVANLSFGFCSDDDGANALAQQVNYLASLGVVMTVAHGNAHRCGLAPGAVRTMYPGSASYAITVGGSNDRGTVDRGDETNYSDFLRGPRGGFNIASPNFLALKPDIAAPGENIRSARYNSTDQYTTDLGTSMATAHATGAAAIVLEARSKMNPGSLKDLLRRTADTSLNAAAYDTVDPQWDDAFGAGLLNVWAALSAAAATDVGFPTCVGPPSSRGRPCALSGGLPPWNNAVDIDTGAPPQVGVANTMTAEVSNGGSVEAVVLVNFGIYEFAVGNSQFHHIGSQRILVPAGNTVTVEQEWIPASPSHQCAQVSIDYGLDTNFDNNVTQRNLQVAPSLYTIRVENPYPVSARFELRARSLRDGWVCRAEEDAFTLHPYRDGPKEVRVTFEAPRGAGVGERGGCDIGVLAQANGSTKQELIGGVSVETFVPKPCRMIGWIRDVSGQPISNARVVLDGQREPVVAVSDRDGVISMSATPYRLHAVTVEDEDHGHHSAETRFYCGIGAFEIVLQEEGVEVETHQRETDWYWDRELRPGANARNQPE